MSDDPDVWSAVGVLVAMAKLMPSEAYEAMCNRARTLGVRVDDVAAFVEMTGRLPD